MLNLISRKVSSIFIITWGLGGVLFLLCRAVVRLFDYILEAIYGGLSLLQWGILILWTLWMLFAEGDKGFRRKFSPRVVARAFYLAQNPSFIRVLLAPIFCMGFFGATVHRMRTTWLVALMIVLLVVLVSFLEQPWRGIIDTGVVFGLVYGIFWICIFTAEGLFSKDFRYDPETK